MAEKPAAERTEHPTPRRLSKAKGRGQVPRSEELSALVSIVVLVAMVAFLGSDLMDWLFAQTKEGLTCDTAVFRNTAAFLDFINIKIIDLTKTILPILIALSFGGIASCVVVSGLNFSPGALELKFDALNPVAGFGNLVNMRSLVRLGTAIAKLIFIGIIVWYYLQDRIEQLAALRWAWSLQILTVIGKLTLGMMIRICLALLLVSLADTAFQKWKYIKDLMMTKQEVKEERKQSESPPEAKRHIRKMQFQLAMQRMMQEVPKANVVLVNPTHVAVALRYDAKTMEAPKLVAKGADHMAEKIREIARAYGVPIIRRPELARTIYSTVKLDGVIPDTLYVAVAEVLAMIYRLKNSRR